MRVVNDDTDLKIVAISGTYVVALGINLPEHLCNGLLGFSIHRMDHTENESYYLEGMKCFSETDPGFPAGSMYSTKDHPIQGFNGPTIRQSPGTNTHIQLLQKREFPLNCNPLWNRR